MSPALLTLLLSVLAVVLGSIAVEYIRARTTREGYLTEIAREIIRRWRP